MRLTKRDKGGNAHMDCSNCEIKFRYGCCSTILCWNNTINRLADFEDKEGVNDMAKSVEKRCISLPPETLQQLEWIRQNVLHAPESVSFSGLVQMAISLAYYKYMNKD